MADNIRKPARARRLKRVAIVMASVSTFALAVFVVIALLPHGGDAFSIRIDKPASQEDADNNRFHMSKGWSADGTKDKDENGYISGAALDRMTQTTAQKVEEHLTQIREKKHEKWKDGFDGQQNFLAKYEEDTDDVKGYALVYTVYLVNDSKKDLSLSYSLLLDSYVNKSKESSALDYFRVLIQHQIVDADYSTIKNIYYGRKHTFDQNKNVNGGDEEAISTFLPSWDVSNGYEALFTTKSEGKDVGYCVNFQDINPEESNQVLLNSSSAEDNLAIPVGKVLRFTYAAYFEGGDPDSNVLQPNETYMKLSLHFGL